MNISVEEEPEKNQTKPKRASKWKIEVNLEGGEEMEKKMQYNAIMKVGGMQ